MDIVDLITNNGLLSTLIGAAIIGVVAWAVSAKRDGAQRKSIYDFLRESQDGGKVFVSEHPGHCVGDETH